MSDNITINSNTTNGPVLATDEIGGVHYQVNKIAVGGLNAATLVDSSNPFPVMVVSESGDLIALTGSLTETAPASDTASSGINGRLQRIAQRLTSLINLLPTSIGQKTGANSFSVVPASDAVFITSGSIASDGTILAPDSLDQTLAYDGSNNLTSITVTYNGNTYRQTFTYTSGNLTGVSKWVKQ